MTLLKSFILLFICFITACNSSDSEKKAANAETPIKAGATPVTLTEPMVGNMSETVELNAVSAFQLRTYVKSSATGYLQLVNAEIGKQVNRGQVLFIVRTKESQSLGSTITSLDSSLHFDGAIKIKSPGFGYISQLNYRSGDYVQDGEQMAVITDTRSFVFMLALPYELKPFLASNRQLKLTLPDGTLLDGFVSRSMPSVDSISQTQNQVIKVNTEKSIPENLIAKVTLVKQSRANTISLPKSAVLSDEIQSSFWIMQLMDSVTAIKVPVTKGLESAGRVEILTPRLKTSDKILLTGNYGLPDTAKVTVIK